MFGTGLTLLLPPRVRQRVHRLAYAVFGGSRRPGYPPKSPSRRKLLPGGDPGARVAVVGMFSTRSGLRRAAQLMLLQESLRGSLVKVFDASPALDLPVDLDSSASHIAAITEFDPEDIVIHVPPPGFLAVLSRLPKRTYAKSRVIAYWYWELERAPASWLSSIEYADEIWVPSKFVRDAISVLVPARASDIHIVPIDPWVASPPSADANSRKLVRQRLGLRAEAFVCGFSFSCASGYHRKNPLAVVSAFQRAFPLGSKQRPSARLLLRCLDGDVYQRGWDQLQRQAAADNRIVLSNPGEFETSLSEFYSAIDVFVSLHRSEGFGLMLAEAAQLEIPVVCSGWQLDEILRRSPLVVPIGGALMRVEDPQGIYSEFSDLHWNDPSVDEAAQQIISLYDRSRPTWT